MEQCERRKVRLCGYILELLLMMEDDYNKRLESLAYYFDKYNELDNISVKFIGDKEPITTSEKIVHSFHRYIEIQILSLIKSFEKEYCLTFKGMSYNIDRLGRIAGVDVQFEKSIGGYTMWSPEDGVSHSR
jgi:hypothetical protein